MTTILIVPTRAMFRRAVVARWTRRRVVARAARGVSTSTVHDSAAATTHRAPVARAAHGDARRADAPPPRARSHERSSLSRAS